MATLKLSLVISIDETAFNAVAVRGEWEAGVAWAAELGYDGVELAVRDPASLDPRALHRAVRSAGLEVAALGTGQAYLADGFSLTSDDAGIRAQAIERIRSHIRLGAVLQAPVIIGLIRGRLTGGRPTTDGRLREGLEALLPSAEESGLELLIEPINRYETDYLNTVDETLAVIRRLGSERIGVLADTFHMNVEEASIEAALRRCGSALGHVHIADSNRQAPGRGHLDFPSILSVLEEIRYARYLSAEILPLPDPSSAARQTVEHMRRLLTREKSKGGAG